MMKLPSIEPLFRDGRARLARAARHLAEDVRGVSLVEFAAVAPVFLTFGLFGAEIANMATTKMRVSQIALSVADNASRLGQTENSGITPTITEADVTAVLQGALRQGRGIDLATHGRVILSSLEYDDATGKQYIHWQRCVGSKARESAYGNDTDKNGINGPDITGMGYGSTEVTAESGTAVMYVEVYYDYQNISGNAFGVGSTSFAEEAAFIIRDDRNLDDGMSPIGTASTC